MANCLGYELLWYIVVGRLAVDVIGSQPTALCELSDTAQDVQDPLFGLQQTTATLDAVKQQPRRTLDIGYGNQINTANAPPLVPDI
ncbi:hypothetical protein D3C80_980130 [compost metagenome]